MLSWSSLKYPFSEYVTASSARFPRCASYKWIVPLWKLYLRFFEFDLGARLPNRIKITFLAFCWFSRGLLAFRNFEISFRRHIIIYYGSQLVRILSFLRSLSPNSNWTTWNRNTNFFFRRPVLSIVAAFASLMRKKTLVTIKLNFHLVTCDHSFVAKFMYRLNGRA